VVVKLISAGEIGGVLDICLRGLSDLLDFVPPTLREGRISDITPEGRTFLMTLGTMVGAGVPILEEIKTAGDCSRPEVKALAVRAHDSVREDASFCEGLRGEGADRHFGPVTMAMLDVGDETGDFDSMCMKAATR
jgi:type II secretory pathway component PulF